MGCLAPFLAALAGMFVFLLIGFAISSWWGAAIAATVLLILVTALTVRANRRAATFGSVEN